MKKPINNHQPKSDFVVEFRTEDGNLIQSRKANKDYFFTQYRGFDKEFVRLTLKTDARRKSVRVISHRCDESGVYAIVEYI